VFLGKLLRYDYSLQCKGVLEISELALEGPACKHSTMCAELTAGMSEAARLGQCTTVQGEELGAAPRSYRCSFWVSVTLGISGPW